MLQEICGHINRGDIAQEEPSKQSETKYWKPKSHGTQHYKITVYTREKNNVKLIKKIMTEKVILLSQRNEDKKKSK